MICDKGSTTIVLELLVMVVVLGVGIYDILYNVEENKCGMTWMYEYPEFIKVKLPVSVQKKYPKYSLFVYGEGWYADYLTSMKGKYKLTGIPVVFIHGNAGSYKQVRSPGSVSLRKSESRPHHFNYFTVDYEEELSALYGPFLKRQTEYLYHCIKRILQCYKHMENGPTSVIAVGHSMGGLVIRGLFALPKFKSNLISTVINLATPQTEPPITLDAEIHQYYTELNKFWKLEAEQKLRNVILLSLGGGFRDYLVRSDLCLFNDISNNPLHMSALTSSIPFIWRSTDHQCIVWCNELVRAITRGFFRMIDNKTDQITQDKNIRANIVKNLFFDRNFIPNKIDMPSNCEEMELKEYVSIHQSKTVSCYYITMEKNFHDTESINIWAYTTSNKNWIYSCDKSSGTCENDGSINTITLPGAKQDSYFVSFCNAAGYDIVMLNLQKSDFVFTQKRNASNQFVTVPNIFPHVVEVAVTKTFYMCFHLISFTESWQTYLIKFDTFTEKVDEDIVVKMYVPWSEESNNFIFDSDVSDIHLKLFKEKPMSLYYQNQHVQLMIWKNSLSNLKLSVTPLVKESVGQFLRFNITSLLRYSLLFGVIRALLSMSSTMEGTNLLGNILTLNKSVVLPLLFLISSKMLVWFYNGGSSTYLIQRMILPQICSTLLSLLLSDVIDVILKIIFTVLSFILFPFAYVARLLSNYKPVTSWYGRRIYIPLAAMSLSFIHRYCSIGVILVALLVIHVIKIQAQTNLEVKIFHWNVLLVISPTLIVFSITSVIVYVQDIIKRYAHEHVTFRNLQFLAASYFIYLLSDFNGYLLSMHNTKKSNLCKFMIISLFVLVFFCLFPEILMLYNLTYVAMYYLVVILSHNLIFYF